MECTEMMVFLACLIKILILNLSLEKKDIFNKISLLYEVFRGDVWERITSFLSTSIKFDWLPS